MMRPLSVERSLDACPAGTRPSKGEMATEPEAGTLRCDLEDDSLAVLVEWSRYGVTEGWAYAGGSLSATFRRDESLQSAVLATHPGGAELWRVACFPEGTMAAEYRLSSSGQFRLAEKDYESGAPKYRVVERVQVGSAASGTEEYSWFSDGRLWWHRVRDAQGLVRAFEEYLPSGGVRCQLDMPGLQDMQAAACDPNQPPP